MSRRILAPILIMTLLGSPGVVLFAVGVMKIVDLRQFLKRAVVVEGRVASLTHLHSTSDSDMYDLAVDYPAANGKMKRVTRQTENGLFQAGQAIDVLLADGDVRIRGFDTTWTNPLIFTIVGLAWASFAGLFLYVGVRHRPD